MIASSATKYSERIMTDPLIPHLRRLDTKIKEMHVYTRVSMQLLVAWFTFFCTINFATLGWLAKPEKDAVIDIRVQRTLAFIFIAQNILGIVICFVCEHLVRKTDSRITTWEKYLFNHRNPPLLVQYPTDTGVPVKAYCWTIRSMIIALLTMITAWVIFALPRQVLQPLLGTGGARAAVKIIFNREYMGR
jgi:hypothetical protein